MASWRREVLTYTSITMAPTTTTSSSSSSSSSPLLPILLRLSLPPKKRGSGVIMKVSHFSWEKRKLWLRGHSKILHSSLFTFYSSSSLSISLFPPPPPPLGRSSSFFIYLYQSGSLLFATSNLCLGFVLSLCLPIFTSIPLQSCYACTSPPSLSLSPPLSPLSDSGSISSASRVVLLSQWPITQSHCLSSGTDRISRICRLTRHTHTYTQTHTHSLGHLSLRRGQTTCGFFFVCAFLKGKEKEAQAPPSFPPTGNLTGQWRETQRGCAEEEMDAVSNA